ncbi:MAG: MarR family EPS-associated transcriptional regulator [Candidatus Omnitrophota bacterium]|jgi:EPS-associated MarR family transcriptional regulator
MSEQYSTRTNGGKIEQEDTLYLLSEISNSPHLTQRELSSKLKISLGKTNYLIQQLIKKGVLKADSFSRNPDKLKKISYILTKKGLQEKIDLTLFFLKVKEEEYNKIKFYWEQISNPQRQ